VSAMSAGASAVAVWDTEFRDARAIACEGERLRLVLVPEVGAKIVSLVDCRTGREWLASPPRASTAPPDDGDEVGRDASYGWDECFPSVAPGEYPGVAWQGAQLVDHG
jgi:hypothetical protein